MFKSNKIRNLQAHHQHSSSRSNNNNSNRTHTPTLTQNSISISDSDGSHQPSDHFIISTLDRNRTPSHHHHHHDSDPHHKLVTPFEFPASNNPNTNSNNIIKPILSWPKKKKSNSSTLSNSIIEPPTTPNTIKRLSSQHTHLTIPDPSNLRSIQSNTKRFIRSLTTTSSNNHNNNNNNNKPLPLPLYDHHHQSIDQITHQLSSSESGHSDHQTPPIDLYRSPDLNNIHHHNLNITTPPTTTSTNVIDPQKSRSIQLVPQIEPTRSRWNSTKLLNGFKLKRYHQPNPSKKDEDQLSITESRTSHNFRAQSRTSFNLPGVVPNHQAITSTTPVLPLDQHDHHTALSRSTSLSQSHHTHDRTTDCATPLPFISTGRIKNGFSFRKRETAHRDDQASSPSYGGSIQQQPKTFPTPVPIDPSRPPLPSPTITTTPSLLERCKSPTLSSPYHRKPLKSAFGLIMRQDSQKSPRHSRSMTSLNLHWINRDPPPSDVGSCLIDPSLIDSSIVKLGAPNSSDTQPPPTTTLLTSSKKLNSPANQAISPSSSHIDETRPDLEYSPADHHPIDWSSQPQSFTSNQAGHRTGRLSPTKLALSRLDEIIRGVSTVPTTTPENGSAEVIGSSSSSIRSGHHHYHEINRLPKSHTFFVSSPPTYHHSRIPSITSVGMNGLSPPMRRYPQTHGSGSQLTPRGYRNHETKAVTSPIPSTPLGKKVMIKPSTWDHISISASEYRFRRREEVGLLGERLPPPEERGGISEEQQEVDESTDDGENNRRRNHNNNGGGGGGLRSPVLRKSSLFSQETLGRRSKDSDEVWDMTMGNYRQLRCRLLVGDDDGEGDDVEEEEEEEGEEGEGESLVYQTSPSSVGSSNEYISGFSTCEVEPKPSCRIGEEGEM